MKGNIPINKSIAKGIENGKFFQNLPEVQFGEWISETPIPRWINIDQNKLNKDYFLSALDRISTP